MNTRKLSILIFSFSIILLLGITQVQTNHLPAYEEYMDSTVGQKAFDDHQSDQLPPLNTVQVKLAQKITSPTPTKLVGGSVVSFIKKFNAKIINQSEETNKEKQKIEETIVSYKNETEPIEYTTKPIPVI